MNGWDRLQTYTEDSIYTKTKQKQIKRKTLVNILFAISILGAAILSCLSTDTKPKPPHFGVFFEQNGGLIELQEREIFTIPVEGEIGNAQTISDSQPIIIIWRSNTNLDYLEFYKLNQFLGQSKNIVRFSATPEEDGVIKIIPVSPLENGIYCLIQGDPLAISLPGWCFQVETGRTNEIPSLQSESTESGILPDTATPQVGLKKEWTIKTGDIRNIGVASDGKIYGVDYNLYAVISEDGEVLQTNEVDLTDCLYGFYGGSGDVENDAWFVIKPDGTILTFSGCKISPGNPPIFEKRAGNSDFFPYADDLEPRQSPLTPDGFVIYNSFCFAGCPNPYLFFSPRSEYDLFINVSTKMAAFVNHNGEISYFDLPNDLDLEKYLYQIRFAITPWDDVYYTYQAYDNLGNSTGEKIIKIEEDGTSTIMSSLPSIISSHPIYLPDREELYVYQRDSLAVYGLDFNFLRKYPLPSDFPKISSSKIKLFVGYDGNVYVFDTEFRNDHPRTLTKYSLPSSLAQAEPTPPNIELNGEWEGEWTNPAGYLYTCVITLEVSESNNITGQINWVFEKTPREDEQSKIGLTAIEYINGTYDPQTRQVMFSGYERDDPYNIISLDDYRLFLSVDGNTLSGESATNQGDWQGKLTANRKP